MLVAEHFSNNEVYLWMFENLKTQGGKSWNFRISELKGSDMSQASNHNNKRIRITFQAKICIHFSLFSQISAC